jgi:hypothetical protein
LYVAENYGHTTAVLEYYCIAKKKKEVQLTISVAWNRPEYKQDGTT